MRNDNLMKNPKTRKDIIRNWVYMSDEEQEFFDFQPDNYGYMVLNKMFDIQREEVEKAIEYYFGDI